MPTVCLAAWMAVLSFCGPAAGDDRTSDQRFLAGLRQRALFELARRYCTDRLGDPQLPDSRRAELTIELSLTLADWAVNSAPDEREPLWQRALEVTQSFARQHPDSPRLPLVRMQEAVGFLARGELARQEAQLLGNDDRLLREARTSLQAAVRRLSELADQVEQTIRERSMPGGSNVARRKPEQLTIDQLASLQENIRYQLARTYRNQAECYPADSADRTNFLALAADELDPLAKLNTSHPLAWESRLDEIVCHRLLADYSTARRKLDNLLDEVPPPAIALRARAEQLRLAMATGRLSEAVAMLSQDRQIGGVASPELDYACLETLLAAWRAAGRSGDQKAAAEWLAQANEMLDWIRRRHGPYWTRRAQVLLAGSLRQLPGGGLDTWIQVAENAYHGGQHDEALAAYDRARTLAEQQGDRDRAFHLAFVAATIEHQRDRHEEAMSRYRGLATSFSDHPKAPEAHVLALYHAGQAARKQTADSLQRYIALAEEHLQIWPHASTVDEVRWCLGRSCEHQGDWQKAVEQYQAISPDYSKYAQVVEAAERCHQAWLDERETAGEATGQIAQSAAEWFEKRILGPQNRLPERWSPLHQKAAVASARFRLRCTPPNYRQAEWLLSAAIAGGGAPPEWQATARALLVFSLAGQGRHGDASAVLEEISTGPPDQLIRLLEGLSEIAAGAGEDVRVELAALQLGTIALLEPRRGGLNGRKRQVLDRFAAEALANAGRTDEALEVYRRLAKAYSEDGLVQEGYAGLLLTREDSAGLEAALAQWRQVEKKSRTGTARWFRAKYSVAWLHYRLGNRVQAEKIIQLLQVLHPEMGGPEMKARFLKLLEECRRPQAAAGTQHPAKVPLPR